MKPCRLALFALLSVIVFSCGHDPGGSAVTEAVPAESKGVILSAEVAERAGVTFGRIETKMLSHDITARGQILLLPDKLANVSVMMGGTIQTIRVHYGQKVRKGDVLATYTHPEIIQIQQNYINAMLDLEVMEKEHSRQETLWKEKVKSDKEYQEMRMEYLKSLADFNSTRAKIEMMHLDVEALNRGDIQGSAPIVSPIAGRVENIHISLGQYVDTHEPLFLVIDNSSPVLQLKVFEKDIYLIEEGQRVTFASSTSGIDEYEAEIVNVGSLVEQEARIIYVMAEVTSQMPDMIPGMFVAATIHTREQYLNALPETAVVLENDNTKFGFYTLDAEGSARYEFYPFLLSTGFVEEGYVEVVPAEELPSEALIVLTGVYYLKSEMMKNIGD